MKSLFILPIAVLASCTLDSSLPPDAVLGVDAEPLVDAPPPDAAPPFGQQAYLKASNTGAGDEFSGTALSADGSTLVVGAVGERSAATGIDGEQADDSAGALAGAAYVFVRSGGGWSQQAYLKASNTEGDDRFGASLAISADGSTIAIGAATESSAATGIDGDQADNSAVHSGAVYVFTRAGVTWTQQAYIKASHLADSDQFGNCVALSANGTTLAVGANGEASEATGVGGDQTGTAADNSGAVYVFARAGVTWSQQAYVKASNTGAGDEFGLALSLAADGSSLAVGARFEDSAATGNQADDSAAESGAVYVFTRTGVTWSQQAYLKGSNTAAGDRFGYSVALTTDATTLVVGALFEDSAATGVGGNEVDNSADNSGAAYVFERTGTAWSQVEHLKASNTAQDDLFGRTIAISGDGSTIAVGADLEDSAATGIDGNDADNLAMDSGAVYLFTRGAGATTQRAYVKASNTGAGDRYGLGLALSADGSTLAVSGDLEDSAAIGVDGDQSDESAMDSGAVYLYR